MLANLQASEWFQIIASSMWPMVKATLMYSIPLTLISFFFGLVLALGVALIRISPVHGAGIRVARAIADLYVSAIRGTPLLVQLFIIFYGLPNVGITLNPVISAVIGFSLSVGAYGSEIVRGALMSVPQGQWEAGYSIGMSYTQALRRIVLPQALRVSVPPLSNAFIALFKDTSLASLVLVVELFRVAQEVASRTYEFMLVYIQAALIYWAFCLVLTAIQNRLEKRLDRHMTA